MKHLATQLAADRRTRDAAYALCKTDIAFIREDLQERSVKDRALDRAKDGAMEVADEARTFAEDNPYKTAAGVAAAAFLFAGGPIIGGISSLIHGDHDCDCDCDCHG
ncbi:hypothetical protein [Altericroceibacterium xinjiangense]|uniref:hypothetical protein n=1 Tax=Altericroceibacterium xinjiangense TaxID=762261 RepID=UPI000F7E6FBC|nr:hypothetical protein [Altericroceibacterium xinjiangense]